jgi:phosphoglycerol transferase MdoB-like AlkP superfamily enzyme
MKNLLKKEVLVILYYMVTRVILFYTTSMSIFHIGLVFDIVLLFFIMMVINFVRNKIVQNVLYISLLVFICFYTISTIEFYEYFRVLLSVTCVHEIKWLGAENTGDYSLLLPNEAYPLILILIGTSIVIFLVDTIQVSFKKTMIIGFMLFFVNTAIGIIHIAQKESDELEYFQSTSYLYQSEYDRVKLSEQYGFFNYLAIDLFRFNVNSNQEMEAVDTYFSNKENHLSNDYTNVLENHNIITILAETLDTRFITEKLTPNLYYLKSNGLVFDNYYTTVFQNGATCNSEFMSLTGINMVNIDQVSVNACDKYNENSFPYSLPNQLNSLGYDTYYFHGQPSDLYDREITIPNYGFKEYYFYNDIIQKYPNYSRKEDSELVYFMDEYVDYSNPFYINFLSYSMHGAYNQKEFDKYNDIVMNAYPNETNNEIINYLAKLVSFDKLIEGILNRLEQENVLDQTMIMIYPDHYPYMFDYEYYLEYHQIDEYELMHQDLILYSPSLAQKTIHTVGSTEDITPTILNLVSNDSEFRYFTGMDLLSNDENYVLFHDMTITNGTKFVHLSNSNELSKPENRDLKEAIIQEIYTFEISRKILHSDYFQKE